MGPHLIGTAGVEHADLGRAHAPARLIRADIIREVVVGGAERVSAVVTHPRTAGACGDLEANAVVRRRIHRGNARTCIGNKKGGGNGKETQKHIYKYNSPFRF